MRKKKNSNPLFTLKLIILSTVGFLLSLSISLLVGTRSFNFYCSKALAGENIGSYIFRDLEKSGFKDCILNTLTLDPYIFIPTLYGALFVLHVCLITQFEEKKVIRNLARIFLISILFVVSYQLIRPLFQQIHYNPWEGMVSITHRRTLFFLSSSSPLTDLLSLLVWALLFLTVFQSGPIVMTFLLNRFKLSYGYKPGIKSFLYVFVGASLFQLLTVALTFGAFSFIVRARRPVLRQIQPAPEQVSLPGGQKSRDTTWKKYQNEKYQFEIQFPAGWYFQEPNQKKDASDISRPDSKKTTTTPLCPYSFFFTNNKRINLITQGEPHGSAFDIGFDYYDSDFSPQPQAEKETINGLEFYCYHSTEAFGNKTFFDCWGWINSEDYLLRLTAYATNQEEMIKNGQILEKMLSSFKYTKDGFVQETPPYPSRKTSVVVHDKEGKPYSRRKIIIFKDDELFLSGQTNSEGKFFIRGYKNGLPSGKYRVEIEGENKNFLSQIFYVKDETKTINLVL